MATITTPLESGAAPIPPMAPLETLADVMAACGDVPPERIRFRPYPGTATEEDVVELHDRENRLFELVDGVLVEKTVGYLEALLAGEILHLIRTYLIQNDLGQVSGADSTMRFKPGRIRIPDVAFVSWSRCPDQKNLEKSIPDLVPDLAVEVLSKSNTGREMDRKLREYFEAGTKLVWYVDPKARTVQVFTSVKESRIVKEDGLVDGGEVLPGFSMNLADLFARPTRQRPQ